MGHNTYNNQQPASKKTFPGIIGVILLISVQEKGPLIIHRLDHKVPEIILNSEGCK